MFKGILFSISSRARPFLVTLLWVCFFFFSEACDVLRNAFEEISNIIYPPWSPDPSQLETPWNRPFFVSLGNSEKKKHFGRWLWGMVFWKDSPRLGVSLGFLRPRCSGLQVLDVVAFGSRRSSKMVPLVVMSLVWFGLIFVWWEP